MAAKCEVTLPTAGGDGVTPSSGSPAPSPSGPLQGADAECYDRAVAAMNYGGTCYEATPTACSDACKAELQSFQITDACWVAILSNPLVSLLLGEDHL